MVPLKCHLSLSLSKKIKKQGFNLQTCSQVEWQRYVLSCGFCQQTFLSNYHRQQLHPHASAPDGEEIPRIVGL